MASKPRFTAHIQHTADTVDRLYRTARRTYDAPRVLLRCILGAALAVSAMTIALPVWAKALLLLTDTWLLTGRDLLRIIWDGRNTGGASSAISTKRGRRIGTL